MSPPSSSDLNAVAELYRSSYSRLVGVVTLAAGSRAEAEECVQEAFLRLLRVWGSVSRYDDPEAWLRLVAFRLAAKRRRKAGNAARALLRLHDAKPNVGPDSIGPDVRAALGQLSLSQRQVVVLHHLVGLSVDEVARQLELPTGTVKSRLSRARTLLAPLLAEENSHA